MRRFNIDVYDVVLHVAVNYDKNKFYKTYFADIACTEQLEPNRDHFKSKAFTWGILSTKKDPRVIFVNINLNNAEGLYDLIHSVAHEAFHAACGIMKFVDCQLCDDDEEAYAYLIGTITKYIYKTVFEPENEQL